MRAVILAAGRGSRLGKLGENRPKCLVELVQRPLLVRQIAALRSGGIDAIGVVRGYRATMIDLPDITCFDNTRWAETNMVASLETAAAWLRAEPVVVSYGDIFYRSDLVRKLAAESGDLVVTYDREWHTLWRRRFEDPLSDAETFRTDSDGKLLEIGGKTVNLLEIEGQYMGLLKFTPTGWRWVEQALSTLEPARRDRIDMTGLLRQLLTKGLPIATLASAGHWGEVDNASDLALYERMVREGDLTLEDADLPRTRGHCS